MSEAVTLAVTNYVCENDYRRNIVERSRLLPNVVLGSIAAAFFTATYFNKIGKVLGTIGTVVPLSFIGLSYGVLHMGMNRGVGLFAKHMDEQMKEIKGLQEWPPAALNQLQTVRSKELDIKALQLLIPSSKPRLPTVSIKTLKVAPQKKESLSLGDQLLGQVSAWTKVLLETNDEKDSKQARDYAAKQVHDGLLLLSS